MLCDQLVNDVALDWSIPVKLLLNLRLRRMYGLTVYRLNFRSISDLPLQLLNDTVSIPQHLLQSLYLIFLLLQDLPKVACLFLQPDDLYFEAFVVRLLLFKFSL